MHKNITLPPNFLIVDINLFSNSEKLISPKKNRTHDIAQIFIIPSIYFTNICFKFF